MHDKDIEDYTPRSQWQWGSAAISGRRIVPVVFFFNTASVWKICRQFYDDMAPNGEHIQFTISQRIPAHARTLPRNLNIIQFSSPHNSFAVRVAYCTTHLRSPFWNDGKSETLDNNNTASSHRRPTILYYHSSPSEPDRQKTWRKPSIHPTKAGVAECALYRGMSERNLRARYLSCIYYEWRSRNESLYKRRAPNTHTHPAQTHHTFGRALFIGELYWFPCPYNVSIGKHGK